MALAPEGQSYHQGRTSIDVPERETFNLYFDGYIVLVSAPFSFVISLYVS